MVTSPAGMDSRPMQPTPAGNARSSLASTWIELWCGKTFPFCCLSHVFTDISKYVLDL